MCNQQTYNDGDDDEPEGTVPMPAAGRAAGADPHIGQAPGDLGKLQAFVNTLDIERSADELATPRALDDWLAQAGLIPAGASGPASDPGPSGAPGPAGIPSPSGAGDLTRALELREALREVLAAHVPQPPAARGTAHREARADAGPGAEAAARLRHVTSAMQARIGADADGRVVLTPADSGSRAALTRLLLIAAEAATLGTWARLKVCSADDCRWAFYDRSPTHSGCWCSMQICGSRAKSRAYRSRAARPA